MNDMTVKPFKIGQYVVMSEEGLRNYGEKYRNVIFKIDYVCPIDFNFIGRECKGIVGEHSNDLVEIKDGKESDCLFSDSLYDYELTRPQWALPFLAERWK